jgi:hypothetical protein
MSIKEKQRIGSPKFGSVVTLVEVRNVIREDHKDHKVVKATVILYSLS